MNAMGWIAIIETNYYRCFGGVWWGYNFAPVQNKRTIDMHNAILLDVAAAVCPQDTFDTYMILGVVLGVAFLYGLSRMSERRNRKA